MPVLRDVEDAEQLNQSGAASRLPVQNAETLPIPFVRRALASGGLVLEIGAGVDICSLPQLVKTDAYLYSSGLDYVADAHRLPFEAEVFDYVFSLAVFEHLHSPWLAADEIFRVLKPGGQVYVLAAFHQHVHGYPNHFFNATDMGLKRLFHRFDIVHLAPSRYAPLEQIAVSLLDVMEMVEALSKRPTLFHSDRQELMRLETALSTVVELLPGFGDRLMNEPEAANAWARVAPGFEIIASKR